MYCTGYLIRDLLSKHSLNKIILRKMSAALFLCSTVIVFAGRYVLELLSIDKLANLWDSYDNPVIVLQSIFMFFLFLTVNIKNDRAKKLICIFSAGVLPAYMITD
ncbi:MAG: hypothetical protein LIO87_08010, partial [Eubacterium sp.]|nr:hypothetical protein [Eubacterium sp.]